ncbi:MAG TPA: hypothetical protein VFK32_05750 [Tepidiformaceae bacterium]|nr:hypothetical protein [Tepidiformaceae bacterium]
MGEQPRTDPPIPVEVAITDAYGALRTAGRRADGGWESRRASTHGAWPAWEPGARRIAVSSVDLLGGTSAIELVVPSGEAQQTIFRSAPSGTPVIAPGVPHYVAWSPAGTFISYVAQTQGGLALHVAAPGGMDAGRVVATGAPLFSCWAPDERSIAVHAGADLALYDPADVEHPRVVSGAAAGFRTPAFSPDGAYLIYATPAAPGAAVMAYEVGSGAETEIARFPGAVAFAFRPGTMDIDVAVSHRPETGVFEEIFRLSGDAWHERVRLWKGASVAYFHAPGGDRMAIVLPAQTGDGRYTIRVVDNSGGTLGATEAVFLSGPYRTLLSFFDQYRISHCLWAPDGSVFLIAGRMPGDGVHATFGDPVNLILAWRGRRSEPLNPISEGEIGFFPPPAVLA